MCTDHSWTWWVTAGRDGWRRRREKGWWGIEGVYQGVGWKGWRLAWSRCLAKSPHWHSQSMMASSRVQVPDQQMPSTSDHFGKWKHSARNFQSPRISTKAPRSDNAVLAVLCREASSLPKGNPSCRQSGCLPGKSCLEPQETRLIKSSHVFAPIQL